MQENMEYVYIMNSSWFIGSCLADTCLLNLVHASSPTELFNGITDGTKVQVKCSVRLWL